MIDKITIPVANPDGSCGDPCPFLDDSLQDTFCRVRIEADLNAGKDARPGLECTPGEYALVQLDELAALRADSERLGEIFHERINRPARIPIEESCCVGCVRYGVVYKLNEALEACRKACELKLHTALAGKEVDA
jgi:hypothetical protein